MGLTLVWEFELELLEEGVSGIVIVGEPEELRAVLASMSRC
jgi:hypothetical protein